jgi:hypothetical protein
VISVRFDRRGDSPLARRLLTMVAILSIAVTGVATAAAFVFVRKSAADTQTRHLAEYVGERVKTEDRLFSDLVKVHDAASEALTRRLAMGANRRPSQFERLFPEKGDGTRRTVSGLFDGARIGNRISSMASAAICPRPRTSACRKRRCSSRPPTSWPTPARPRSGTTTTSTSSRPRPGW